MDFDEYGKVRPMNWCVKSSLHRRRNAEGGWFRASFSFYDERDEVETPDDFDPTAPTNPIPVVDEIRKTRQFLLERRARADKADKAAKNDAVVELLDEDAKAAADEEAIRSSLVRFSGDDRLYRYDPQRLMDVARRFSKPSLFSGKRFSGGCSIFGEKLIPGEKRSAQLNMSWSKRSGSMESKERNLVRLQRSRLPDIQVPASCLSPFGDKKRSILRKKSARNCFNFNKVTLNAENSPQPFATVPNLALPWTLPKLSKRELSIYKNSMGQNVCQELLYEGFHRSFAEMFQMMRLNRRDRDASDFNAALRTMSLLEHSPRKLSSIRRALTAVEKLQRQLILYPWKYAAAEEVLRAVPGGTSGTEVKMARISGSSSGARVANPVAVSSVETGFNSTVTGVAISISKSIAGVASGSSGGGVVSGASGGGGSSGVSVRSRGATGGSGGASGGSGGKICPTVTDEGVEETEDVAEDRRRTTGVDRKRTTGTSTPTRSPKTGNSRISMAIGNTMWQNQLVAKGTLHPTLRIYQIRYNAAIYFDKIDDFWTAHYFFNSATKAALDIPGDLSPKMYAECCRAYGRSLENHGYFEEGIKKMEEFLELSVKHQWVGANGQAMEKDAYIQLSRMYSCMGNLLIQRTPDVAGEKNPKEEALEYYHKAFSVAFMSGERTPENLSSFKLGLALLSENNSKLCLGYLEIYYNFCKENINDFGMGKVVEGLARAMHEQGDNDLALKYLNHCVEITQRKRKAAIRAQVTSQWRSDTVQQFLDSVRYQILEATFVRCSRLLGSIYDDSRNYDAAEPILQSSYLVASKQREKHAKSYEASRVQYGVACAHHFAKDMENLFSHSLAEPGPKLRSAKMVVYWRLNRITGYCRPQDAHDDDDEGWEDEFEELERAAEEAEREKRASEMRLASIQMEAEKKEMAWRKKLADEGDEVEVKREKSWISRSSSSSSGSSSSNGSQAVAEKARESRVIQAKFFASEKSRKSRLSTMRESAYFDAVDEKEEPIGADPNLPVRERAADERWSDLELVKDWFLEFDINFAYSYGLMGNCVKVGFNPFAITEEKEAQNEEEEEEEEEEEMEEEGDYLGDWDWQWDDNEEEAEQEDEEEKRLKEEVREAVEKAKRKKQEKAGEEEEDEYLAEEEHMEDEDD